MAFTEKQKELIKSIGINVDFDNLSDDDICDIMLAVGDELTLHGLDENYEPNERGKICEEILWKTE